MRKGFYISSNISRGNLLTGIYDKIPEEEKQNLSGVLFKGIEINENGIRDSLRRMQDKKKSSGVNFYDIFVTGKIECNLLYKNGRVDEVLVSGITYHFIISTFNEEFVKAKNIFQETSKELQEISYVGDFKKELQQNTVRKELLEKSESTVYKYVREQIRKKKLELETLFKDDLKGYHSINGNILPHGFLGRMVFFTSSLELFNESFLYHSTDNYKRIQHGDLVENIIKEGLKTNIEKVAVIGYDFDRYQEYIEKEGWLRIRNIPVYEYRINEHTIIYFTPLFALLHDPRQEMKSKGQHITTLFNFNRNDTLMDVIRAIEYFKLPAKILTSIYKKHLS